MRQSRDPSALSQALAEPSRRSILENLRLGHKSVGELVVATGLKQPNVSNHLARMNRQGIVHSERSGRRVYYSLALPVAEFLLQLHENTADPLTALEPIETGAKATGPTAGMPSQGISRPVSEQTPPDSELAVETWRQAYFQTLMAGNEDRANALVNTLLADRVDIETIYHEVFEWAMHRVGDLYVQGATDEAHEHMASAITERMIGRVSHFYTPVARKPYRALLGAVAGNWHVIGLRMLSDGLRTQGWETIYLGANVPTAGFLAMATTERPDLVVVSCMRNENLEELRLLLQALQEARNRQEGLIYRVAAGGRFLNHNASILHELPVDFSAPTLRDFLATVAHLYPVAKPSKNS